jgi:hypothetical protein
MSTFYIAATVDGADMLTPDLTYQVGETITHPYAADSDAPEAFTQFSMSDTPSGVIIHQWPARLLVIEPVGDTWETNHTRVGAHQIRVVSERPATELFGPQGEEVVALFEPLAAAHAEEQEIGESSEETGKYWYQWNLLIRLLHKNRRYPAWRVASHTVDPEPVEATINYNVCGLGALMARDLLDHETYAYLTASLRSEHGRIHPDDPETF